MFSDAEKFCVEQIYNKNWSQRAYIHGRFMRGVVYVLWINWYWRWMMRFPTLSKSSKNSGKFLWSRPFLISEFRQWSCMLIRHKLLVKSHQKQWVRHHLFKLFKKGINAWRTEVNVLGKSKVNRGLLSWSIVVGSIRANFSLKEVMSVICTLVEIVKIYKCIAFIDKLTRIVDCWNLGDASKRTSAQTYREM